VLQGGVSMLLENLDIFKLLNYGTGTAIAIVLVFFVIKVLLNLVRSLLDNQREIVGNQSNMIKGMADTLKDVAGTLLVIQDNIKDLQQGQDHLWKEVRNLKTNRSDKDGTNS
jgi:predicted PurR-regulated permease PerM